MKNGQGAISWAVFCYTFPDIQEAAYFIILNHTINDQCGIQLIALRFHQGRFPSENQ